MVSCTCKLVKVVGSYAVDLGSISGTSQLRKKSRVEQEIERKAYFHWNCAPSREQSVPYIIILVSNTSLVNKNTYTFFAKRIYLRWLGCSPNWASLVRLLTQISGGARHARQASWVGLGELSCQIWHQPTRAQPSRFLTSGRARPPEVSGSSAALGRKGAKRAHKRSNCLLCEHHLNEPDEGPWGSGTLCDGVSSWLSLP